MLAPDELKKLFRFDDETGQLFWLPRGREMFEDERQYKIWNTRFANCEAMTADNGRGYRVGTINRKNYLAHRVIWALTHGEWPPEEVDHINGNRKDNRLCNLRAISVAENRRNQKIPRNNKTGVIGLCKSRGKYLATIRIDRRNIFLGRFDRMEDAIAARKTAESRFGFHENHGRAA